MALAGRPCLENVPVQAIRIGDLRILALPGEPFTAFGSRIRQVHPSTWVVGYANGSVSYLPTRNSFSDPSDYACYCAQLFITLFPFAERFEEFLVEESLSLLLSM